jgi:tRNA A37 threonylcarbamoyladenosine synthetase subunit TsaC/SUA5/YrdC
MRTEQEGDITVYTISTDELKKIFERIMELKKREVKRPYHLVLSFGDTPYKVNVLEEK